jgi:hypothetical protein
VNRTRSSGGRLAVAESAVVQRCGRLGLARGDREWPLMDRQSLPPEIALGPIRNRSTGTHRMAVRK